MKFKELQFGSITIDGTVYDHDVVIDRGRIRKRRKKPSRKYREHYDHTPISVEEEIPWKCRRLVIGTGKYGSLPLMDEVKREARRRGINLAIKLTNEGIEALAERSEGTMRSCTSPAERFQRSRFRG